MMAKLRMWARSVMRGRIGVQLSGTGDGRARREHRDGAGPAQWWAGRATGGGTSMFHVKHFCVKGGRKSGTMRFCKTTLWIKKSGNRIKEMTFTRFGSSLTIRNQNSGLVT